MWGEEGKEGEEDGDKPQFTSNFSQISPGAVKVPTTGGSVPTASKGRNPYLAFAAEKRPAVRTENPSFNFAEVNKVLGEMWRELSREQKEQYRT
mmetsp:Transcript_35694/g.100509  ORF Transcript_35694/g.100509 Transcript_35694/m.100509 type:complete len:94 (-) Transcript_35694:534-815(-)